MIPYITITDFTTLSGYHYEKLNVYYEIFGKELGTAPIVLVNHALTGNSTITGKNGWWTDSIGKGKTIDTDFYTILSFNIPGNGYGASIDDMIENYQDWTARDVARVFLEGLKILEIEELHSLIGCSLGGGIVWEMAVLQPNLAKHLLFIATDWKATDWIIGNCLIQEKLLQNKESGLHDARLHAMLCYRSPESFKLKFGRSISEKNGQYNVESWLLHHGKKLQQRFSLASYKLMNQIVKSIDITRNNSDFATAVAPIFSKIHIIGVSSDLYFLPEENRETHQKLKALGKDSRYYEIESAHGHDAFLIDFGQLNLFLEKSHPKFNLSYKNLVEISQN